jgi:hypothetical protein
VTSGVLPMCVYDGWGMFPRACSIEVHASAIQEVLDPARKVFSLKFEPTIEGRVIP